MSKNLDLKKKEKNEKVKLKAPKFLVLIHDKTFLINKIKLKVKNAALIEEIQFFIC